MAPAPSGERRFLTPNALAAIDFMPFLTHF
jgi:hypothetical protein